MRLDPTMMTYMVAVCRASLPGWWKVIAAFDDADAGLHDDVWPLLMQRFRVENGELAGQGFNGQVRIANLRD